MSAGRTEEREKKALRRKAAAREEYFVLGKSSFVTMRHFRHKKWRTHASTAFPLIWNEKNAPHPSADGN